MKYFILSLFVLGCNTYNPTILNQKDAGASKALLLDAGFEEDAVVLDSSYDDVLECK